MSTYNLKRFGPDEKLYITQVSGPSSYSSGGFTVDHPFSRVSHAIAIASGGYIAEASVSGNTVTVKVYSGAGSEVTAGTDLSGVTITVIIIGR